MSNEHPDQERTSVVGAPTAWEAMQEFTDRPEVYIPDYEDEYPAVLITDVVPIDE